ncbi:MAG: ABC transporter substrate-binding protein, partial [Chloroflexi bacterium]|nr:ABC transporter substrate-binding protein [Chloroflexota bacterium]
MVLRRAPFLAALLVAGLLAACTPAASPTPTAPAPAGEKPAARQVLTVGVLTIVTNYDPHQSTSGGYRKLDVFETLLILDDTGQKVEPLLATDWQAQNATTWRLTIRQDAKFHDGTPLTTEDIAFSWQRLADPELKSPIPGRMSGVERISRLDERTVEVVTRTPDPLLLKKLTLFAVVPKAYTERIGAKEFVLKPVGSGPFKVREYVPDQRLVLEAFSEHAYRKPKLQQIVFRPIPESAQRLTGLRLGEIDVAQAISFEQAEQARREGFTLTSNDYQIMGIWFDTWGMDGNPGPIKDKRVRQAIAYTLD